MIIETNWTTTTTTPNPQQPQLQYHDVHFQRMAETYLSITNYNLATIFDHTEKNILMWSLKSTMLWVYIWGFPSLYISDGIPWRAEVRQLPNQTYWISLITYITNGRTAEYNSAVNEVFITVLIASCRKSYLATTGIVKPQ